MEGIIGLLSSNVIVYNKTSQTICQWLRKKTEWPGAKHCPRMDNGSEEMFFPSFFPAKTICGKGFRNRSIWLLYPKRSLVNCEWIPVFLWGDIWLDFSSWYRFYEQTYVSYSNLLWDECNSLEQVPYMYLCLYTCLSADKISFKSQMKLEDINYQIFYSAKIIKPRLWN